MGRFNKLIKAWDTMNFVSGTFPYDDYPTFEEWEKQFEGYCGMGSPLSEKYYDHLPVWTGGNAFFNGARPSKKELAYIENKNDKIWFEVTLEEKEGKKILSKDSYHLYSNLFDHIDEHHFVPVNTEVLGKAFEPEMYFEDPDGQKIELWPKAN